MLPDMVGPEHSHINLLFSFLVKHMVGSFARALILDILDLKDTFKLVLPLAHAYYVTIRSRSFFFVYVYFFFQTKIN